MVALHEGATLQGGKYIIEGVIGQGGFGITYLAIQSGLERKVAIKEFFMKELCERDESTSHVTLGTEGSRETVNRFREKFLKEARNIARLNHPNIVRIIDVFEENGTAYYVMEYAENGSLADKVKREGYLTEPVATRYILQVADALDYIHQRKMNHLDVKPANIMLNEKDEAILIDFGLSKQYDAVTGGQTSTTPVGISEGYAPMEQYKQGGVGEFSPETDIYALGATFFKLLTGITPPSASDIYEDGVPVGELKAKGVSQKAIEAVVKAMNSKKRERLNAVNSFTSILNVTQSVQTDEMKSPDEKSMRVVLDSNDTSSSSAKEESVQGDNASKVVEEEHVSTDLKVKTSRVLFFASVLFLLVVSLIVWVVCQKNQSTAIENMTENGSGADFESISQAAEAGDADAMVQLGIMYISGNDIPEDRNKGFEYFKKAAEQDNADGYAGLGLCYENGLGTSGNIKLAVQNYKKAAEGGNTDSMIRLYNLYRQGEMVVQDPNAAIKYLRLAADSGDLEAMFYLGYEYGLGEIVETDNAAALEYLKKSADAGYATACVVLGTLYYVGEALVEKDYDIAFRYLTQAESDAASIGDNTTLAGLYNNLSECYRYGRGTKKDADKASHYEKLAKECQQKAM